MAIKILTKNSIENTNIDGARANNFNAGRRSGIVKGVLNEGRFFASSSNVIALDTCELRLCGHRVVIDSIEYKTFTNTPSSDIRYSLVAQISVDINADVTFALNTQLASTALVQDNLDETGIGVYELEIGRFTLNTSGEIEDVVRTADIITGGTGQGGESGNLNIGTVITTTLAAGLDAEVDIENRYNPQDNKTYTDFSFSIPQGATGSYVGFDSASNTLRQTIEGNTSDVVTFGNNAFNSTAIPTITTILNSVYPVGSIYVSVNSTSPASLLGGTWVALDSGYVLQTMSLDTTITNNNIDGTAVTPNADNANVSAKISSGLPNITGWFEKVLIKESIPNSSGALEFSSSWSSSDGSTGSGNRYYTRIELNASRSSGIYGRSSIVQPPAIKVYMWRRTA